MEVKQNSDNNILLKRLLLSLGILIFIRMGTFLPVPGIDLGVAIGLVPGSVLGNVLGFVIGLVLGRSWTSYWTFLE